MLLVSVLHALPHPCCVGLMVCSLMSMFWPVVVMGWGSTHIFFSGFVFFKISRFTAAARLAPANSRVCVAEVGCILKYLGGEAALLGDLGNVHVLKMFSFDINPVAV